MQWEETYSQAYKRIAELLSQKRSVIYDATNFTKEQRDFSRNIALKHNANSIVLFVDVPKNVVLNRLLENRKTNNRFNVRDEDFAQVLDNFRRPTPEENVLVFDESMPLKDWLKNNF